MKLADFLDLYDNWNGNLVINDRNCNLYARVRFDRINNGNYDSVLKTEVMAFGFYDGELCVRVNY